MVSVYNKHNLNSNGTFLYEKGLPYQRQMTSFEQLIPEEYGPIEASIISSASLTKALFETKIEAYHIIFSPTATSQRSYGISSKSFGYLDSNSKRVHR
jgi:hypothetical protein